MKNKSDSEIIEAVKISETFADCLRNLGINPSAGNYRTLHKNITRLGLVTSHFLNASQLLKKYPLPGKLNISNENVFVENSTYHSGSNIKKRMIASNLTESCCAICKLRSWNNQEITLELDHINGLFQDNRIENLRLLCPNCHSQTSTFKGRNKKDKKDSVCKTCGCQVRTRTNYCRKCSSLQRRGKFGKLKDAIPQEVFDMANNTSMVKTGKHYDVSDNAIKKFLRKHFPQGN